MFAAKLQIVAAWEKGVHMKKRNIVVIALLICVLLIPMAGSLAFFTADETAHNVITTGTVDIELQELMKGEDGSLVTYEDPIAVMPGTTVSKIVQVKNTGTGDAWVRIEFTDGAEYNKARLVEAGVIGADGTLDVEKFGEISKHHHEIEFNTDDWEKHTENDGATIYFYYKHKLAPGETTEPLMKEVKFPAEMGNVYQSSTLKLTFSAQAVQVKNNGEAVMEAKGWPAAGAET